MPPIIHLMLLLRSVQRSGMTTRKRIEIERLKKSLTWAEIRYAYAQVCGEAQ